MSIGTHFALMKAEFLNPQLYENIVGDFCFEFLNPQQRKTGAATADALNKGFLAVLLIV